MTEPINRSFRYSWETEPCSFQLISFSWEDITQAAKNQMPYNLLEVRRDFMSVLRTQLQEQKAMKYLRYQSL